MPDNSYLLTPSIGRPAVLHDQLTGNNRPFDEDEERRLFEAFKREARPRISYTPQDEIEWLAIGQHHGLVTRLLDWTKSMFVAAYFATEYGDINKSSRIYCVKEFNSFEQRHVPSEPSVFQISHPYTYRPPHISPRIAAQQAVFTVHHKPQLSLETPSLRIFDIPGACCIKLKRMLDVAGFNRASLFPDLDGLSQHLSWRYKWNWPL